MTLESMPYYISEFAHKNSEWVNIVKGKRTPKTLATHRVSNEHFYWESPIELVPLKSLSTELINKIS